MGPNNNKNKRRLIFVFAITSIICTLLTFRVGWIQVVANEKYAKAAESIQTRDEAITPKRGEIYDRNGKELAISAATNLIWARTPDVKKVTTKDKTDEEIKFAQDLKVDQAATSLSAILGIAKEEVVSSLQQEKSNVRIAKDVAKETADLVRAANIPGITVVEDTKRYYPMGAFAAHILGTTSDDNRGISGIELQYDKYLSGVPGRWIKDADLNGENLSYGVEKYFQAEDGLNVVLTIDEVIQNSVEKALDQVQATTQANRTMCIVMNPKTGDVLAMGTTPDFDLNNPKVPLDPSAAAYVETLDSAQKLEYWNAMWRNPMICDTYEPGSIFKLLTTSIALENGVTYTGDQFYCSGAVEVADRTIRCWSWRKPHGQESLVQAVGNSCNPVFVELEKRIGREKYYQFIYSMGMNEKTGIDYPGEARSIIQPEKTSGPVELANMSFGQGIAVTPISMLTAVCSIGNDGKIMQPKLVKELTDSKGNVVEKFPDKVVRQVISEQTVEEMKSIMEAVVVEGGGKIVQIPGYKVGGKTATAQKVINGTYSQTQFVSSMLVMAPMDDPQLAILFLVDEPKGAITSGSQTAGPGIKTILEESFRYLKIEPSDPAAAKVASNQKVMTMPDVTGWNYSVAYKSLSGIGLQYAVIPAMADNQDFVIVDQYPKAGSEVAVGDTVYLYRQ